MVKLYISFSHQQHGLLRHVLPKMLWISKISKKKTSVDFTGDNFKRV